MISWFAPHVAELLAKYIVGKDGRTRYDKIRGNMFIGELLEFGCCVHFQIPVDTTEGGGQ